MLRLKLRSFALLTAPPAGGEFSLQYYHLCPLYWCELPKNSFFFNPLNASLPSRRHHLHLQLLQLFLCPVVSNLSEEMFHQEGAAGPGLDLRMRGSRRRQDQFQFSVRSTCWASCTRPTSLLVSVAPAVIKLQLLSTGVDCDAAFDSSCFVSSSQVASFLFCPLFFLCFSLFGLFPAPARLLLYRLCLHTKQNVEFQNKKQTEKSQRLMLP